jgi:hypothetical protein
MSKSYGKVGPGFTMRGWHTSMRGRERLCIQREMRSAEYGDVVFPIVPEISDPWSYDAYRSFDSKKDIRDEYFKEIRNILNGYNSILQYGRSWLNDCYGYFLECFNLIKGNLPSDGRCFDFEWLNLKEAKDIIKGWEGDPVDVLYYLTDEKIIEKAVNREFQKRTKK